MTRIRYANRAWFFMLITLVSGFSGCRNAAEPSPDESAAVSTSAAISKMTVTDRLDRVVHLDHPAKRIVCLAPAMTELLFELDLGDSIVGATKYCNFPPAALEIPRVGGGTLESVSLEAIVDAKPDLVLCKWDSHQALVDSLDRLNVPALAIGAQSLDELFEQAKWVGLMTGHEEEADSLVVRMRSRRDELTAIVSRVKPDPPLKVFYEVWDEPLMSAGPHSFIDELLSLAGLENIIRDTEVSYPQVSSEIVLQADPDLILSPTSHINTVNIDDIRSRPGWQSISAVKRNRIHLISGDEVSRCGPRVLDALAEIIQTAYPEVSTSKGENDTGTRNTPGDDSSQGEVQP